MTNPIIQLSNELNRQRQFINAYWRLSTLYPIIYGSNPIQEWIEDLFIAIRFMIDFFLQYSMKIYYFWGAFKSRTDQICKTTKSDSFPDCPRSF